MSGGNTHLLTVIDRFTRWPEAIPLAQTTAASIGRAFALHWVARFGVPSDITSDRGPHFTSAIWRALAESLGTKVHHTTAYHPQANGLVERFHRSLKAALRARLKDTKWMDELPWVMLGSRSMPKQDMGVSVAEMVLGTPTTVLGTFVGPGKNPETADHLQRMWDIAGRLVPAPDAWHGKRTTATATANSLPEAEYVFVRRDFMRRMAHSRRRTPGHTESCREMKNSTSYSVANGKRVLASTG